MPKYRNIYTGEVAEWTARNDLGVMEREDGTRWAIYGFNDEFGKSPRFLSCHEFIAPPDPATPAPAPISGGDSGESESGEE